MFVILRWIIGSGIFGSGVYLAALVTDALYTDPLIELFIGAITGGSFALLAAVIVILLKATYG